MQADNKEMFDSYLSKVNIKRRFECDMGETTLAGTAIYKDDWYYFKALLKQGAKCTKEDLNQALGKYIWINDMQRVIFLLELGAQVKDGNLRGATENNSTDMVALLLKHGASPKHLAKNDAMRQARRHGNIEMEQLLLDAGAPPLANDPARPPVTMPEDTSDMKALWTTWLDFYRLYLREYSSDGRFWGETAQRIRERQKKLGNKLPRPKGTRY